MNEIKIYYYGAEHCMQCRAQKPRFEAEIERLNAQGVSFIVDAEEEPEMALKHGIRSVPCIVVEKGGEVIAKGPAADMIPELKNHIA